MSQENVEIIQALIPPPEVDLARIFRDDDLFDQTRAAFEDLIDPDVESMAPFIGGVTYLGVNGFRKLWLDWLEPWATYHTRIDELIDAGDSVVALVRDRARRHDMDAEVELIGSAVWEFRDGRIVRVTYFRSRAEALEAAGLSE